MLLKCDKKMLCRTHNYNSKAMSVRVVLRKSFCQCCAGTGHEISKFKKNKKKRERIRRKVRNINNSYKEAKFKSHRFDLE